MPNRLTQVPGRPVPPLPRWTGPVVPLADLFMRVMVSRPGSGSLRRTWVTPATLQMCVALVAACLVAAGLAAGGVLVIGTVTAVVGGCLLLLGAGAAAVALVGLAQRQA